MAELKLSQKPLATLPLAATEEVHVIQGGKSRRTPLNTSPVVPGVTPTVGGEDNGIMYQKDGVVKNNIRFSYDEDTGFIDIEGLDDGKANVFLTGFGDSTFNSNSTYRLRKARGSRETPTSLQAGDSIGGIAAQGYDGTDYINSVFISALVDGVVSGNIVPGSLSILTANSAGSLITRMHFKSSGKVGIGTTDPTQRFSVFGDDSLGNFRRFSDSDVSSPGLLLERARGTQNSPSAVVDGTELGKVHVTAHYGAGAGDFADAGFLKFISKGDWGAGSASRLCDAQIIARGSSGTFSAIYIKNDRKAGVNTTNPVSAWDVNGSEVRIRNTKTPTGTADPSGNVGDMCWDDNNLYVKTSVGWKQLPLQAIP